MSSTRLPSTEANAIGSARGPGSGRTEWSTVILILVILVLLGALVWSLNPRQPKLAPAPLRPVTSGCLKLGREFVPSNITEIPQWQASPAKSADAMAFTGLSHDQKERVLLGLNTEPCTCGCKLSIAACRVNEPDCGNSGFDARRILDSIGH